MTQSSRTFINGFKLATLFGAVSLLSACVDPIEPVRVDAAETVAADQNNTIPLPYYARYEVVMVRNGCEVGHGIRLENGRESAYAPVALCPPPGTAPAEDRIAAGVSFKVVYKQFGCEVGVLELGPDNSHKMILCPSTGETTVTHVTGNAKTGYHSYNVNQRRPG